MKNKKHPNLYIIGAPKCGTTSVANWLNQHNECYLPEVKEPHYFNDDDGHQMTPNIEEYLELYNGYHNKKILIDASVWYLFSKNAVRNIEAYTENNAKYIVCIRNPIEMVEALHAEQVLGGNENIHDFKTAWEAQVIRANGEGLKTSTHAPSHLQYGPACKLGEQIEKLLKQVDRKRVLFVFLENMKEYPDKTFKEICKFLEVERKSLDDYKRFNKSKNLHSSFVHKSLLSLMGIKKLVPWLPSVGLLSGIKRLNIKEGARITTSEHTKSVLLMPYFKKDIEKLENLLGKDLSHWRV